MNFITILSIFQSIFSKFSDYLLLILFLQHYMAAGFIGADQLVALFYHIAAADRALLGSSLALEHITADSTDKLLHDNFLLNQSSNVWSSQ